MFLSYILREEKTDLNNQAFGHCVIFSAKRTPPPQVGSCPYAYADWSKDHQAIPSPSTTSTEWALQRFLRHKESYHRSYPLLLQVTEICLSMPVSNARPERGASALKRLKTCLRNSLKEEMLTDTVALFAKEA